MWRLGPLRGSNSVWVMGITQRIACEYGASTGCSGLCPLPNSSQTLPILPNSIVRQAGVRLTTVYRMPPFAAYARLRYTTPWQAGDSLCGGCRTGRTSRMGIAANCYDSGRMASSGHYPARFSPERRVYRLFLLPYSLILSHTSQFYRAANPASLHYAATSRRSLHKKRALPLAMPFWDKTV